MEFFSENHEVFLEAKSKAFSIVYQIKKSDFLRLIHQNKHDYVKEKYIKILYKFSYDNRKYFVLFEIN